MRNVIQRAHLLERFAGRAATMLEIKAACADLCAPHRWHIRNLVRDLHERGLVSISGGRNDRRYHFPERQA